jgi:hypothetical protein
VIALEHHAAYLNATKRDGRPFEDIIRELRRKPSKEPDTVPVTESDRRIKCRRAI